VCHKCQHHARLSARERIAQLVDEGSFTEHDAELGPSDPLDFDAKGASYRQKLAEAASKSGESEAAVAGSGRLDGQPGLARPARAGQREQPVGAEQPGDLGELVVPADEAGQPGGQVGLDRALGGFPEDVQVQSG